VLLIVAALAPTEVGELLRLATACGLDAMVEAHNRAEVETALEQDAAVIGINNRDLRTFTVDIDTTLRLLPHIPAGRTVVSESGIRTPEQVRRLADAGVNAILVGETFMASPDIAEAVRILMSML
jgi:indole-3-glycerol phosphate synthase